MEQSASQGPGRDEMDSFCRNCISFCDESSYGLFDFFFFSQHRAGCEVMLS